MEKKHKIGIIGLGNMGLAIAEQLKSDYSVFAFDNDQSKISGTEDIKIVNETGEIFTACQSVLIAVKPQDIGELLQEIKPLIEDQIIISIAAGIKTSDIEAVLKPKEVKVIRAMPNLFAVEGRGVSGICKGAYARDNELIFVHGLFQCFGEARIIDEGKMDAVTAVSGSGPGYMSYLVEKNQIPPDERAKYIEEIIPKYIEAAKGVGFVLEEAKFFAETTANNLKLYFQTHPESPAEFRKQVTSKGGTTEAAINVLQSGGSLVEAVRAALERARELSSKFGITKQRG